MHKCNISHFHSSWSELQLISSIHARGPSWTLQTPRTPRSPWAPWTSSCESLAPSLWCRILCKLLKFNSHKTLLVGWSQKGPDCSLKMTRVLGGKPKSQSQTMNWGPEVALTLRSGWNWWWRCRVCNLWEFSRNFLSNVCNLMASAIGRGPEQGRCPLTRQIQTSMDKDVISDGGYQPHFAMGIS